MSQDTNIPNLVINKLTKQQYEGTTPSNTELYFVTDEDAYLSSNQGSANAGKVLTVGNDGTVTPEDPVGVTDYTNLINKPQINGNVLNGNDLEDIQVREENNQLYLTVNGQDIVLDTNNEQNLYNAIIKALREVGLR